MLDIQSWIDHDPDPTTREELLDLKTRADGGDEEAKADLADRFSGPLTFGTAGLRGKMGGGPHRMNRAVVRQAAAGLIAYLQDKVGRDAFVVIGFDARYHSRDFATDTAAIITAAGGRAAIMPRTLPTPLLAWAVRHLGADAGVMVTASHNPPADNGYKVYLGGRAATEEGQGVQIVPPADKEIAEAIAAAGPADEIPLAEGGWETIDEAVIDAYVERALALVPAGHSSDLKIVHTAMHGVGSEMMLRVLNEAGFTDVTPVPEQEKPDPDFPTVSFPNPEEAGALDLATRLAEQIGADLVLANDPDADRCSAAVPADGGWRQLSGDEIGSLLGEEMAGAGALTGGNLASSIVSSRLLGKIAAKHGLGYTPTLTGFKWIARAPELIFGYEEAIGFCVDPDGVRDKDGITASLLLARLAGKLKKDGKSLLDQLDELAATHGVYLTAPVTIRVDDLSLMPATMAHLRANPPTSLAGSPVAESVDLAEGTDSLPPTDALILVSERGDRAVVRPSGTEPKVKCYLEVIEPVDDELRDAQTEAQRRMEGLKADMSAALRLPEN
ncbi:MAG: phospho-sugar mutase [Flaviflexus sp.]|nr:phospho-sugar mutase [Flaviflexus sp.]